MVREEFLIVSIFENEFSWNEEEGSTSSMQKEWNPSKFEEH